MDKKHNDIDELYNQPIFYSHIKERYICPVCHKTFQSEKSAENHKERKTCFNAASLFRNTHTERKMFEIYQFFLDEKWYVSKFADTNTYNFRKEPIYKDVAKFVHFCYKNHFLFMTDYLYFLYYKNNTHSVRKILTYGQTNKWLRKFRYYLKQNNDLIPSEDFIDKNYNKLQNDYNFIIRSLERADVSPHILFQWIEIDENKLNPEQKRRLKQALKDFL